MAHVLRSLSMTGLLGNGQRRGFYWGWPLPYAVIFRVTATSSHMLNTISAWKLDDEMRH